MASPKLFISYSWSSPEHEQWVIRLATELRESGVDVILDKWDLKEGHDAVAFMEQMVTDKTVEKVVMVCDETYAKKADSRAGGVGTESQIISKEVYDNTAQDKFVAVITQKDNAGKPCVPTYYKSRIYIDLSEVDTYSENFERLLRWIYNKRLDEKPPLGKAPGFLSDGPTVSLGTTASFRRAIESIKGNKASALGNLDEYLETFVSNMERFRLSQVEGEYDDALVQNIEQFLPFRNEIIELVATICQYSKDSEYLNQIHRFFENLIPYLSVPSNLTQWRQNDFDNFKFIVHELFLYALAIFIKRERFDGARVLLEQEYFVNRTANGVEGGMKEYTIFRDYLESLERRNGRLKLNRLSVRADLLKERNVGSGIELRHLMQADFVAFLRASIHSTVYYGWWPETLLFAHQSHSAFEVFARASSRSYFDRMKPILGIDSPEEISGLMESFNNGTRDVPKWQFSRISPATLANYNMLATRP